MAVLCTAKTEASQEFFQGQAKAIPNGRAQAGLLDPHCALDPIGSVSIKGGAAHTHVASSIGGNVFCGWPSRGG